MVTLLNYRAQGGCFENMRTNISQFHVQEICVALGPPCEFKPLTYKQSATNIIAQHEMATMLIGFKGDARESWVPFKKPARPVRRVPGAGERKTALWSSQVYRLWWGGSEVNEGKHRHSGQHARLRGTIINIKLAGSSNCTGGWRSVEILCFSHLFFFFVQSFSPTFNTPAVL